MYIMKIDIPILVHEFLFGVLFEFVRFGIFRQSCGWNQSTHSPSDGITGGDRWSLTESRFSFNSSKHIQRRSNYRSPSANPPRVIEQSIPQRNSHPAMIIRR